MALGCGYALCVLIYLVYRLGMMFWCESTLCALVLASYKSITYNGGFQFCVCQLL